MPTYNVIYEEGPDTVNIPHELPERLPQCGDVYEWALPTSTLGGHMYRPGDLMTVLERTGHTPHHRTSALGNLLVRDKQHTSVWTSFEHCIAIGYLKLVGNPNL